MSDLFHWPFLFGYRQTAEKVMDEISQQAL